MKSFSPKPQHVSISTKHKASFSKRKFSLFKLVSSCNSVVRGSGKSHCQWKQSITINVLLHLSMFCLETRFVYFIYHECRYLCKCLSSTNSAQNCDVKLVKGPNVNIFKHLVYRPISYFIFWLLSKNFEKC